MKNKHCLVFRVDELQFEEIQKDFKYEHAATDFLDREKFAFCTHIAFSSPRQETIVATVIELACKVSQDSETYIFAFGSLCTQPPAELKTIINNEKSKYITEYYYTKLVENTEFPISRPECIPERFDLERAACAVAEKYGVERSQVSITISSKHLG